LEMPSGSLASIAVSEDGQRLAVARHFVSEQEGRAVNMTELKLFDVDVGKALWSVAYANPNCCGLPLVKMTPDGHFILGAGKQLHLYAQDGQELQTLSFQDDSEFTLLSAELSAHGQYLAATTAYRAYLFSREGQQLWSAEFEGVPTLALSRDGAYLLVATNKLFELYRTSDRTLIRQGELPYQGVVATPAITDDGSSFAIAGNLHVGRDDLTVFVFRQESADPQRIALGEVNAPTLSFAERWLRVEGALGGAAALIHLDDGNLKQFPSQSEAVHLAIAAERDWLAVAHSGIVELRRLSDDKLLWQARAPGAILALLLSGDRIIALGNEQSDSAFSNRVWGWRVPSF
jgi:dipeptidyl aminopeptidase/acylaminoacyl peptidase